MKKFLFIIFLLIPLQSHANDYDDGYDAGYKQAMLEIKSLLDNCEEDDSSFSYLTSTEVCGGGGVTLNGKYIPGGATGCVKVYSDNTYKQY